MGEKSSFFPFDSILWFKANIFLKCRIMPINISSKNTILKIIARTIIHSNLVV